ncbi:MAG TPA: SDR family NAD(P)-dependent oxidoreductase [Hyphomicrobiales bacterium]|nr:SDR family NAD(P)-dependent oxidoreductase [Hyphomicrobiales bacterium]
MKAADLFDVRGLVMLVTGAASGIGLAIAEVMAENGAVVTLADRDAAALDAAVARFRAAGAEVHGAVADVTDRASLDAAVADLLARHGRLDVVFANAGISGGPGFLKTDGSRDRDHAIEALPPDLWQRVLATNLTGAFNTVQAVVPAMRRQKGGRIVFTSSISATKTELHVGTAYVTSKAGLAQFIRQVALELAGDGILVNAIAPGPVVTNIGGGRLKEAAARAPFERLAPLHRVARPEDIQGAALYFASPASRHVTGAELLIDGGATLGYAD